MHRLGVSIRRLEAHGNRLAPLCLSVFGPLFILFASVYWVLRALFQHGVFIWRLRPADGRRACPGGPASYRLAAGGGRAYRGGYALPLCGPGTHPVSEKGAPSERGMPDAAASFWATVAGLTQAPGKAGGLRKPWKGSLPASLSRGTEYSVSCIACPAPRKRGSSRCVLHLLILYTIPLRSKLTAKAFLLSPAQPGIVVLLKQKECKKAPP